MLNTSPRPAPREGRGVLLIDADYICYKMGFISQSKDPDPGIQDQVYCQLHPDHDTHGYVDPAPLVEWRVDNELSKIQDALGTDSIEVHLTPDKGNFRYEVAVTKPYKSGRNSPRPFHYATIRRYLLDTYGAIVASGQEADDAVCIRQYEEMEAGRVSCIVGIDKDLKCMFGHHYNPNKSIYEWLTWEEAARNFYGQMITGDTVDTIPGIKGRGPTHAIKLLYSSNGCVETLASDVTDAYAQKGHSLEYLTEQGQLLHMRRRTGEMWDMQYDWEVGYSEDTRGDLCSSL